LNENWNKGKSNQFIKGRKVKKKSAQTFPTKKETQTSPSGEKRE
jgi:hypothetical protein